MVDARRRLIVSPIWLAFTVPIALTMGVAAACGACLEITYAKETASWAAQGVGQDLVNLFVVCPALLVAGALAQKGSARALLVWIGLLAYVLYSFVLYAFYTHFNALFPVYVATLGLSFYALLGSVLTADLAAVAQLFGPGTRTRPLGAVLMTVGILFAALWLSDIARAIADGTVPPSVVEAGLPVNPIHVLDLAFALPALMVTAVMLWRRRVYGLFFAVPCGIFLITMGLAIVSMWCVMTKRGVPAPIALPIVITLTVIVTGCVTISFLGACDRREPGNLEREPRHSG